MPLSSDTLMLSMTLSSDTLMLSMPLSAGTLMLRVVICRVLCSQVYLI